MKRTQKNQPITINGQEIRPGETRDITLSLARLYDYTELSMPVRIFCGRHAGPVLFVSAAIHGDEINGVEIVRRSITQPQMRQIGGTLIAVPIVNVFGFNNKSRYLPDRRDLNRSFPGNARGSLASQIAHVFMKEIVRKCDYGIDLHSGAISRENYPHIRALISDSSIRKLAKSFGTDVILNSDLRDGSLRQAATEKQVKILVFEGGEALRFTESAVKTGVQGILSVMQHIGMLPPRDPRKADQFIAKSSHWQRSPQSGIFTASRKLGHEVQKGELLGSVSDPFGEHAIEITANYSGVIVGRTTIPLVKRGDALYNIAIADDKRASRQDQLEYQLGLEDYEMF
jgi:hypothetical protein